MKNWKPVGLEKKWRARARCAGLLLAGGWFAGCAGTTAEENEPELQPEGPGWESLAAFDSGVLGEVVWSDAARKVAVCWVPERGKLVDAQQVWLARNERLEPVARLRFSGEREKNSVGFIVEAGTVKAGDSVVTATPELLEQWAKLHAAP